MRMRTYLRTGMMIAVFGLVASTPLDAQSKKGKSDRVRSEQVRIDRERPTLQLRGSDRYDRKIDRRDDRRDDRRKVDRRRTTTLESILFGRDRVERRRDVPPGWCRGVGNPHNTRENCGWRGRR